MSAAEGCEAAAFELDPHEMSDLDRELKQAIFDSEQAAQEQAELFAEGAPVGEDIPPLGAEVPPQVEEAKGRKWGLLLALLAAGGGILALVFSSAEDAVIYSVTTDQLLENQEKYEGRMVRVEGELVKGSLRYRAEPCEYRFQMATGEKKLAVRYAECVVPDTFRDVPDMDVEVTAEGRLAEEGHFEATHIMAKCPSKYEMQERSAKGEAAPHAVLGAPLTETP